MPTTQPQKSVKLGKAKITSAKRQKGRKIKVTWKKVQNADGYQVQWSTGKIKKGKKTLVIKNKAVITRAKKKKYQIRVRACRINKGKVYYGAGSKIKRA